MTDTVPRPSGRSGVRLGTRGSALALAQAALVREQLEQHHSDLKVETVVVRTGADRAPDVPLRSIGDKALWVADLEEQLLRGEIDLAVHSMKDLPAALPPGLTIGAVPARECPLDALVLPAGTSSANEKLRDLNHVTSAAHYPAVQEAISALLAQGARVGTSSDRRRGQLLLWRSDLEVIPVRGNVDTRLRKLDGGEFQALLLAAAGLRRLGLEDRVTAYLPARRILPPAGQGALAIEVREDDAGMRSLLQPLHDGPTAAAVAAERAFVRAAGGGCSVPLGVYTSYMNSTLELWVRAAAPTPRPDLPPIQDLQLTMVPDSDPFGDISWAEELGTRMGERFLDRGGRAFLARVAASDG